MRLGEKLIRGGLITQAQLDDALKQQVVHGGRLGTNLVELGALELDDLARALADQMGVAAALTAQFAAAEEDPATPALLPPALAEQHQAVPLGREPATDRLAVAFIDPLQLSAVDEIGFATGARLRAHVGPELSVLGALERLYGIAMPARFRRVSLRHLAAVPEARRWPPTPSQPFRAARPPVHAPSPVPHVGAAEATARLGVAASREEIGELLLAYLASVYAGARLTIERDDGPREWKAFGEPPGDGALACPIRLGERVVSMVHVTGGPAEAAGELEAVCQAAAGAFARLIHSRK